ncbi:MAG: DUF3102 domain-containing protein [Clostridia bacterium]|nr:DUF3102 domain-containing protein [Clostridia bacterium]
MTELQTVSGGMTAQRTPETVAAEIRSFTASMLVNIIEIGRRMVEVKAMLPHGEFLPWLKENTGYSSSTANNFMRLYEEYGADQGCLFGAELNCQTFGNLTYSKALALLSVPKNEREAFMEEVDAENLSTRELKEAIAARDAVLKQAEEAKQRFLEEKETSDALLDENDSLREQVKELEARAKDVIVAEDPAKVDEAVRKALEDAKAAHEKEVAALKKKAEDAELKKANLEKAVKAAEEKAAAAKKETESKVEAARAAASGDAVRYQAEADALRKQLAMADPVTAEFKGLFEQATAMVGKLLALMKAAPEDKAPKLRAAMDALGKQIVEG